MVEEGTKIVLFNSPINSEIIFKFSKELEKNSASKNNHIHPMMLSSLRKIINLMINRREMFDELCEHNIRHIGDDFIHYLRNFSFEKDAEHLSVIFHMAYRFLCEYEFTRPNLESSEEIESVEATIEEMIDKIGPDSRRHISYSRYRMPFLVLKKFVNNPEIAFFRKLDGNIEVARNLDEKWNSDYIKRKEEIDNIKSELKKTEDGYNFVGLVNGFKDLKEDKSKEQKIAFGSLLVLAVFMIAPPSIQIIYVMMNLELVESKKDLLVFTLPTIITLEVILVYFFRVVLSHFRSVKAQILQLQLRMALCQFVQSYAEYSKKISKDSPEVLAKFESVVFSNLVAESEKIPSTFDGAEQLAALIKSARNN